MNALLCLMLLISTLATASANDWKQAPQDHVLTFPKDHGSHPDQKIEWWYFTGNLATEEGNALGYQLTFFRIGTDPAPKNPSTWTVRNLHMAHFAISDLTEKRYYSAQRLGRAGPSLAGAALDRLFTWNGTWKAEMTTNGAIQLAADSKDFGLNLHLVSERPIVAHGENGYSRKGQQPGNASIYYSFTRLKSTGTVTISGKPHKVSGLSWMDHEFGTSFLEPGQVGWDWFSLQLNDGSDLMLFQIRQLDPKAPPAMSGTLILPDGKVIHLKPEDFKLDGSKPWKSDTTGAAYPLHWKIHLPNHALSLTTTTVLPDQEMRSAKAGPTYWEGAVVAEGTHQEKAVTGKGYLEMTGYSGASMSSFFRGTE